MTHSGSLEHLYAVIDGACSAAEEACEIFYDRLEDGEADQVFATKQVRDGPWRSSKLVKVYVVTPKDLATMQKICMDLADQDPTTIADLLIRTLKEDRETEPLGTEG